jgi:hypothetical protein
MDRAKLVAVILGVAGVGAQLAHATEPDAKAVACLASVLRSAPNAVSVAPAKDIEQHIYRSRRIVSGKIMDVPTVARGVDYTFRKPDGTMMTVGVYLSTQNKVEPDEDCERDPHCVETAMSAIFVPSDNGRFQIFLREPYPSEWYPWAKLAYVSPNGTRYLKQDSPEHPLFALWYRLATKCRADNLHLNSPAIP